MIFNSIDFAIFLPIVFILYWFVLNKTIRLQNLLIVFASYTFYGWWDWRFLFLMFFSTVVDYSVGLRLAKQQDPLIRKALLYASIFVNLGLLGFFKYYNFFTENFCAAFTFLGVSVKANTLDVILPLGISFYTFQTMSYSIDAYKRKLTPTNDFIAFAGFVSFFPQLVAGPIERASNLLPQFLTNRTFNYAKAADGMRQILWGLFKKIVIADNCATYVDMFYATPESQSGSNLLLGAILFALQVYCDFSGYSDIAIGTARLFGFNLARNFAFPFFSRNMAEFYRRWHISLFAWLKDYLYIPLGGNRHGLLKKIRNTFIVFIACGLWHGAGWTFLLWGVVTAIYFIPLSIQKKHKRYTDVIAKDRMLPSIKELASMVTTFLLFTFSCIFFRATDIQNAFLYIKGIFSISLFQIPSFDGGEKFSEMCVIIVGFMIIEWLGRRNEYAIEHLWLKWPLALRWSVYTFLIIISMVFAGDGQQFVYFQF
nr:MBOAT family O-acyltransferase [uncultured Draconibacterium sp.]